MTLVLEEFFGRAVGFEREQALVTAASSVPSRIEIFNVPTLSAVPLSDGQADFAFCCTVLQHMMDESTRDTLAEMRRVVGSGFILLIETSHPGFLDGKYGEGIFTKGRSVGEYEIMLAPWCSDFVRPRHIGSTSGEVWGSLMMFRSPDMMRGEMSDDANWTSDELSRSYVR